MARLSAVADTGPLLAAANAAERSHRLAASLVHGFGRELVIPLPVLCELDHLIRSRAGRQPARRLLAAVADGSHQVAFLSARLLSRAVEIESRYADLDPGLVDASVMAVAEHHRLPILTFDFADFRAAPSPQGPWPLVITEDQFARALESRGEAR